MLRYCPISLTKGQTALVEEADYDAIVAFGRWCCSNSGYAVHYFTDENGQRKTAYMHRVIMQRVLYKTGFPSGMQVDHINMIRIDNRRVNLRLATRSQNQAYKGRQVNTTCYKGVNNNRGRWEVRIRFQGKRFFLGKYEDARIAALIYDAASRHFYRDFAGCNFPDEATPPYIATILQNILLKPSCIE